MDHVATTSCRGCGETVKYAPDEDGHAPIMECGRCSKQPTARVVRSSRDLSDRQHALYRFYAADDRLLYVGITHRIESRLSQHKREKPWEKVAKVTVEHHPNRDAVLAAEREAIQTENPAWNVVHNGASTTSTTRQEQAMSNDDDPLVGHFYHTFITKDDGCEVVNRQGLVVDHIQAGYYLVETYEWLSGGVYDRQIVSIEEMVGWTFYDTAEWWREHYEYNLARRSDVHAGHS